MILPDSGVLEITLLKTMPGVWWCATALAHLKRQGLGYKPYLIFINKNKKQMKNI